jgi:ornithine carbamoyltransferase
MKKDFIAVSDYSSQDIEKIIEISLSLKAERAKGPNKPILKDKVLGMIFQKPSLRTRVSFDMAMRHLGGDALYLSPAEIGLGQRETIADVARVLSGYVDAIMARVFAHQHVVELAKWSSIPVVNGLSDYNHPCQAMGDALTIVEKFGSMRGRTISFIGDGNNVAVSMMHVCAQLGAHFVIASPEGYDLPENAVQIAEKIGKSTGSQFRFLREPDQAVAGADVIYTDTWTSMGQEAETEKRLQVFGKYQVNERLVSLAKPDAIVMHCLPAHRGQEITDEVADGPHSALFPQAHNRMHAQKGILVFVMAD